MIEWLPTWLRSYWLLALPLLLWFTWRQYQRHHRPGQWEHILPPALHKTLLTESKNHAGKKRWLWLALAWLIAVLALAGPSWVHYEQPMRKPYAPLVIMLELTPQMLAQDGQPTRLQQAKYKILDLLASRPDGQTAVVVFSGSAHTLVPLTEDQATITNLLDALSPSIMPVNGHRPEYALSQALALLKQGAQGRGDLLLITSELSDASQKILAKQTAHLTRPLKILGIGSLEGAPITNEDGGFIRDESGAIRVAKLEQQALRKFAADNGFLYQRIRLDDSDLTRLQLLTPTVAARSDSTLSLNIQLDQGYWLVLVLVAMASLAGRRGLLLSVAFCVCLPPNAWSMSFTDLWLRADQQGMRALQAQRPHEAANLFHDRRWQGYALYQAGLYQHAADIFAEYDDANAHYNRGTALAAAGNLEEAVLALTEALNQVPDFLDAQENLLLVQRLLEERKQNDQATLPNDLSPATGTAPDSSANTSTQERSDAPADAPPNAAAESTQSQSTHRMTESEQSLEQWLRQVPDNPGELLKRKFLLELQQRQGESQ